MVELPERLSQAGRARACTPPQEAAVADRVARKTALFAESISEGGAPCRVTPDAVRRMWVEEIMPMTKVVQVSVGGARGRSHPSLVFFLRCVLPPPRD